MGITNHQTSSDVHILLTSLGTTLFDKPTEYEWDGKKAEASLAPLALVKLLDPSQQPNHAFAMVTKGAETTTWPVFQQEISDTLDFCPNIISIPDGSSTGEVRNILEKVAKEIPEGATLTLDVTQGMRHFPFIFYALALYLTSLRGVKILGAYYGMFEAPSKSKPIIDLQPLLQLPEWFHAVRVFSDQGTTKPMAQLLEPLAKQLRREGDELRGGAKAPPSEARERYRQADQVKSNNATGSVDWLERYAFAYESALPLELEKASRGLIDSIKQLPATNCDGLPPLVDELTSTIVTAADKSAFPKPPRGGGNWKSTIPLDEDELKRQSYMIDLYLERGQLSLAAGLMREWVISWAIWKSSKTEECKKWLDNKIRHRHERILGAIGVSARSTVAKFIMTPEQEEFRDFWNQLTDNLRNALHHHAMRTEALENPPSSLETVQNFWNRLKREGLKEKDGINLPPLGGRLLISPQGGRPGVLFSALNVAQPDVCLVICSETSATHIPEAAKEACFKGHIEQIKLTDPLGGFAEIGTVAERAQGYLFYADEVIANITGGSTLMGVIVQRLVEEAQKLARPVKRFALIDRRTTEEQDSDPFVQGDSHWLD